MKLVYYESSQADGALVLVLDKQDMPGLDYEAAVYMGDVTRAGEAELDDDTANKLLDMGMRQHRFYMSGFAPPKEVHTSCAASAARSPSTRSRSISAF